ncbi:hypothetical protein DL98DRAFT_581524 [Cadophora sp. DSE1049]|nr:hypothetical protein DL98DRAFT_581524 [Cadophora sp. DSE1049]
MKVLHLAFYMVVFTALSVVASLAPVHGAELSAEAMHLPWPVSPLEWSGTVNGAEVNITGDLQHIFTHLGLKLPQIPTNSIDLSNNTAASELKYTALGEVESALMSRESTGKVNDTPHAAFQIAREDRAYVWALNVIIYNLSVVPGVCKIKAHSCKRMHCYYGSSVYVCNDSDREVRSDCNYLGSFVRDIINLCTIDRQNPKIARAGGQEFHTDGYNVIVRKEACQW